MAEIENVVRNELIPALTGGKFCSDVERNVLSLPTKLGGLGLDIIHATAQHQYVSSRKFTEKLVENVKSQTKEVTQDIVALNMVKAEIRKAKKQLNQQKLASLHLEEEQKRQLVILQEPGTSSWLNVIPLEEYGLQLTKQEFRDALRIRYGWTLEKLPSRCACGDQFSVQHALSCKKGGFVTLRHNELRDKTAAILTEVCKNVEIEPLLQKLTGEILAHRTSNRQDEARLDISSTGFWIKGQKNFADIRVFDPHAARYNKLTMKQCYAKNESEKKRHYNERVLNVEQGSFSPLVFSVYGSMGGECRRFYSRLAQLLAEKRKLPKSTVSSWLNTKIGFSLIRSMLLCVRGSRTLRRKEEVEVTAEEIDVVEVLSRTN